jgi:hypothetical protein
MPEVIAAFAKVTLGGVVLLDFTDQMESEVDLSQARLVQMVQSIRAANSQPIPRGNISHTLTISRIKFFTTADSARQFAFQHASELPTATSFLTIQWASGAVATLNNAVLASDAYHAQPKGSKFSASYRIVGGALAFTSAS